MRRSHNTIEFVDAIIKAADRLDPVLVNEFMTFGIDAIQAHYELIKPTLSEMQQLRNERVINTGAIIFALLGSLRLPSASSEI
jgi:hypothetical protein